MGTNNACYSPTYKNIKVRASQSPKELKERMRKDYKHKIHNSRNMLFNKFRGAVSGGDLRQTLTEIYNNTFKFNDPASSKDFYDSEDIEEIKNELIEEELNWWLEEYEKTQMDNIDWSSLHQEDNVICPICQKNNLQLVNNLLSCSFCKISIKVTKSIVEIKTMIYECIEKHSSTCSKDGYFTHVPEEHEAHIYFMCDQCSDMHLVI